MACKKPRKRVRTALKIDEMSGVDVPAQEGARALIMKRADVDTLIADEKAKAASTRSLERDATGPTVAKSGALTSATDGHTHLLYTAGIEGEWDSGTTSYQDDHSHPWVRGEDGGIVIGEVDGHSHEVAAISKRTFTSEEREALAESGAAMPDGGYPIESKADLKNAIQAFGRAKNKAAVARHIKSRARALGLTDMLPTEGKLADLMKSATVGRENDMTDKTQEAAPTVEELQAKLEHAEKMATMSDADKAHYAGLDDEAKKAFVEKSADERAAEIADVAKRADDDDPVVYTTSDGVEIRKSAGDAIANLARSNDELVKKNRELAEKAEKDELRKRAETELGHLPGDVETHMALLKSVDSIADEKQRETALNTLRAQDEALAKAFVTVGHGGTDAMRTATEELDMLAKAYQDEHSGVTFEAAYDAILGTEKGQELYAKALS